ncbi:DUF2019 domain-containing protein [Undibacter mobilis]|uniref:DUF2019 domain-containing protein n=1 Tax=Undibacter mobilis TaxID=2292256 RepID=A0A371BBA6_9BRAD|nr:DUF2019 domain-containing protein [Undibacter mobilis]RDV04842.1 DUF2019 domain-containing protein [Undibacter mobilis]
MTHVQLANMTLKMLEQHLADLRHVRDQAGTDAAAQRDLDRQIAATEMEIATRPPPPPTGLEALSVPQIPDHFAALAQTEDDLDDDIEPVEALDALYWKLDDARRELERREGHPGALIALYTHPDIRVRARAADFTLSFAPELAKSRLLAIDDDDWVPPRDVDAPAQVPPKLARMTTAALVERFLDIALQQSHALDRSEISKFNRLFGQLAAVELALKSRDGDQRLTLLPLLAHGNVEVRLRAAYAVRDLAPREAIAAFRAISDRNQYPQAANARGALERFGIKWWEK